MIVNLNYWNESPDVILYCYAQGCWNKSIAIFTFKKLPLEKLLIDLSSVEKAFAGISFLIKSIIPPHMFQIHLKETGQPKKNGLLQFIKILSMLISILSLITSAKEPNLFQIELIFRRTKISLLRLSLRIVCSLEFVPDFAFSEYQIKNH